ncbi:hypothetical protein BpHYR1_034697 [Brachionus plicatilis]|uniref:Uncharacterized protein n=1 Tax=Brachionus plicatilis TaxID=10195 RepID=A0A3M7SHL2_BRAPC|nr:hypothetical protein BpHYR1_034697 [Brachionus plicatilis]
MFKLNSKKSFCAECFEIVLNGYFFVLKRETQKIKAFLLFVLLPKNLWSLFLRSKQSCLSQKFEIY